MDIVTISTAVSSLKTAIDIIKAISALNNNAEINQKVIELQNIILGLQSNLLDLQSQIITIAEERTSLEKKIKTQEAWEEIKKEYQLKEVTPGIFVYASTTAQHPHWLCPNCFDKKKKSIFQMTNKDDSSRYFQCCDCKMEITIDYR